MKNNDYVYIENNHHKTGVMNVHRLKNQLIAIPCEYI